MLLYDDYFLDLLLQRNSKIW